MAARPTITRRGLLVAGGVGGALLVGWTVWPRDYQPALTAGPGEHALNAWLRIAEGGTIAVLVPQAELGQGAYTTVAQMVADELGADWRTVGVEPALPGPLAANTLLADESGAWFAAERARRGVAVATGGSSTVRGFEEPARAAGAEARDRLRRAAADEWGIDWRDTEVRGGFVIAGDRRARFGALAAAAARLPADAERGAGPADRLTGRALPRLDGPGKVDGQATFATDIRLPDLVHASVRMGPGGTVRLLAMDRAAALRTPDVLAVVDRADWVAAVGRHWWAAERAARALKPRWEVREMARQDALDRALDAAAAGDRWSSVAGDGSVGDLWSAGDAARATYAVAPLPHLAAEPMSATASVTATRADVWAGSQAPASLRADVAEALGFAPELVTVYPVPVGGSFGRRATNEAAAQAAVLSRELGRPVQLTWSRAEDIRHDRAAPPARVRMAARQRPGSGLTAWAARVVQARAGDPGPTAAPDGRALLAALAAPPDDPPLYPAEAWSLESARLDTALPTGPWRGGGAVPIAFASESFADELAARAGIDPFSWRIEKLGGDPRLAACLTRVTEIGGWTGGAAGSGQGLAVCRRFGARVAVLAVAHAEGGRIVLDRLSAAVDAGRLVNPDLVLQQVEGQLLFAAAAALGTPTRIEEGVLAPGGLAAHRPLRTADTPRLTVALMPSADPPAGVGSVVVPAVAPAIANALASATGRRVRSLPLTLETARASAA